MTCPGLLITVLGYDNIEGPTIHGKYSRRSSYAPVDEDCETVSLEGAFSCGAFHLAGMQRIR